MVNERGIQIEIQRGSTGLKERKKPFVNDVAELAEV